LRTIFFSSSSSISFFLFIVKKVPVQFGRVCAFGDFNGDSNTDILVQRGTNLTVLLQDNELLNVLEEGVFKNSTTFRVGSETVECSLGDFNGDTKLDVLVSMKKRKEYHHSVWISTATRDSFVEHKLAVLSSQALAIDVDGNGWHDVLGFYPNGSMYCMTFSRDGSPAFDCNYLFPGFIRVEPYPGVPHLFADFTGLVFSFQPKEVALGEIKMASFFDLKEDGSLDILTEYKPYEGDTKFSFIPCDDKGDVTFLKVQVFTNICGKRCDPTSKELGSGVSWSGACASFSMSDGWGGSLKSASCQLPATTHRALAPPYVLFGLGRSPNFVDELTIGAPRYADNLAVRQHTLKQIVPNSRIVVIPPEDGTHWVTRLYVTPSQLILQSLAVIALVCAMLLIVVAFLHYREKKEDRVERQQQSHRFHFDAM
ncbi:FG-GAP repeat protein, partial [Ancylostoma caninum]